LSVDPEDLKDTIIEKSYTIENSGYILLELGNSPVEGSVTISQQANFYKISKLTEMNPALSTFTLRKMDLQGWILWKSPEATLMAARFSPKLLPG
jgi:hypothetical protein